MLGHVGGGETPSVVHIPARYAQGMSWVQCRTQLRWGRQHHSLTRPCFGDDHHHVCVIMSLLVGLPSCSGRLRIICTWALPTLILSFSLKTPPRSATAPIHQLPTTPTTRARRNSRRPGSGGLKTSATGASAASYGGATASRPTTLPFKVRLQAGSGKAVARLTFGQEERGSGVGMCYR